MMAFMITNWIPLLLVTGTAIGIILIVSYKTQDAEVKTDETVS
jgi:hypothetical protein